MKITFIDHSSFLVELERKYLLFDYYKGALPKLDTGKEMYVFSSHSHYDHYSTRVLKLAESFEKIRFIFSDDIRDDFEGDLSELSEDMADKVSECTVFVGADERYEISAGKEATEVETIRSTDLGVAFLIKAEGNKIFHSGDYQWWDWPGEPDEDNAKAKEDFFRELKKLEKREFDLAFLVLDPRQETSAFWGIDSILSRVNIKTVFPMHFWGDYKITDKYRERLDSGAVPYFGQKPDFKIIKRAGESFIISDHEEKKSQ